MSRKPSESKRQYVNLVFWTPRVEETHQEMAIEHIEEATGDQITKIEGCLNARAVDFRGIASFLEMESTKSVHIKSTYFSPPKSYDTNTARWKDMRQYQDS